MDNLLYSFPIFNPLSKKSLPLNSKSALSEIHFVKLQLLISH